MVRGVISAVGWVPRGAAKAVPEVVEPTAEELEELRLAAAQQEAAGPSGSDEEEDEEDVEEERGEELEDAESDEDEEAHARRVAESLRASKREKPPEEMLIDELAELDMDNYDNDDDKPVQLFHARRPGDAYYASNDDDPYITLKEDDDESELEDFVITDSDLLLLSLRSEDEYNLLEVWLREDPHVTGDEGGEGNMYVHHDVMLSAFPLCMTWMDCNPNGDKAPGNFAAVGTMDPGIEIWDLDKLDEVEPAAGLGGELNKPTAKPSKKPKKKKLRPGSHKDAVLALAWNAEYRNVLASSSADGTAKVWDITTQQCEHTLKHHTDKVQAVAWNPQAHSVLLTGSFDKTAAVVDVRVPDHPPLTWQVSADVECVAWDPHNPQYFLVSTEDGLVVCYDVRHGKKGADTPAAFTLAAHNKPTCAMSYNPAAPSLLATASTDKTVKLWSLDENKPSCLASQDLGLGGIFSISWCRDEPFLLAAGGSKGKMAVWDTLTTGVVAKKYAQHVRKQS